MKIFEALAERFAKLNRTALTYGGLAMAAVLFLSVNTISGGLLKDIKTDLTEEGLFTISDGTRDVLSSLHEPVQLKVYFSKELADTYPTYGKYFDRVRGLLEQYRDLSDGKLQVAFYNPEPFSDAEDRAVAAGLRGLQINRQGDRGYFGLSATNSTDQVGSISFFNPQRERFLEYDLTKLVHTLANPDRKTVGLVTSLKIDGGQTPQGQRMPVWLVMDQIREFFDVRDLGQKFAEIPEDIDLLMVAKPSELTEEALYAIDQFALKGGKVLAFVDPVDEVGRSDIFAARNPGPKADFSKLLKSWGVSFDAEKVVADIEHARRVQFGTPSGQPIITEYVGWLGLGKKSLDQGDVLSSSIEQLNLASAGFFEKVKDAKTEFTPILKTSAKAMVIGRDDASVGADAVKLLQDYRPGGKELILAARVTGDVESAFPDGKPQKKEVKSDAEDEASDPKSDNTDLTKADSDKSNHIKSGRINAILVADTDMLHDQFWVDVQNFFGQRVQVPRAHNATFVVNALDNLSGGEALIALRGRGVDNRPFTLVNDIRRDAERRFREKEQALVAKLQDVQKQIAGIEKRQEGQEIILSEKDKQMIEQHRAEMIDIRRELRDVKHALRKDIDRLDGALQFANIGGVPLLLLSGWLVLAAFRRRKSHQSNS